MWGIEFCNEAENVKSQRNRKSVGELSQVKEDRTEDNLDKPPQDETQSENEIADAIPDQDEVIEPDVQDDTQQSSENDGENDSPSTPDEEENTDAVSTGRAPKLSEGSQDSSNLDEEYVIIEKEKNDSQEPRPKPVWRRRLKLRHKLTMHTSFERDDNVAPAAVTALLISKDHRKLFVGDGRGRIYSWSVTDAAGRMPADHWIKDEGAEACTQCRARFTFSERRHHCRDCGKLFCAKCSKYESSIQRLRIYKPVRVCKHCYEKLKKEQSKGFTM